MVAVMVMISYYHTIMTITAIISRSKSYYHIIMTMKATIGRGKSYYHTIMTMTATIEDLLLPMIAVMAMIV
jgi:hypothetical protein